MKIRKFHRILGLILFLFLLNASITGMLRAHAKWLYWTDRPASSTSVLTMPRVSVDQVFAMAKEKWGEEIKIKRIELKSILDKPVYVVEPATGKKKLLLDAETGSEFLPVSENQAHELASTYVAPGTKTISIEKLDGYKARRNSEPRPAWKISYADPAASEIFVDRETAEVLMVLDSGRRFSVWVNRLHELDFAGSSRWFLLALGLSICVISLTGLNLALPKKSAVASKRSMS